MTEFLKKNPIALRHCLLYIFLYEKSIDEPFDDFCKTVGPDVIRKEEFQHWFDQFEQRKFDDNKKPITDMKDVLRGDKNALRFCVLYESLKFKHPELKKNNELIHHPVFSVYMHFCKVIGDDVMEYREFDFWFYRFVNGEFNLDFEIDKEQKIHELMDMPIDIMRNIVEYLNIADRLCLEKTSRSMRLFSQDQKLFHPYLKLDVFDDSVYISFGEEHQIYYEIEGNHCVMTYGDNSEVFHDVSYLKKAFQDFKKILGNRKLYLHTLTITITPWCEDRILLEEQMEGALKFTKMVHVQHLSLRTRSMKALLKILPSLKPGYLTTITINIDLDEATIGKLVEMEQWKQAKYLYMSSYHGPLHHLYHFHDFTVFRQELLIDDVRKMKEILFKSPDFAKCNLFLCANDPFFIIQELGGAIKRSIDTCHYPIPNSNEYFEIFVGYQVIKIERKKK